jgi:histidinol dehydrogenase
MAPLVSTALMTIVPARVAGVREIIVCTPPGRDGRIDVFLLAACRLLGADRVFRVGGAQAIAAMAFGTESVPRVDLIVGPGNRYVTEAKRQLYGKVGIDMTAGPSEVAIIADGGADPALVAADMLSQAEHDVSSVAALFTDSSDLIRGVRKELRKQLRELPSGSIAFRTVRSGVRFVRCRSLTEAAECANRMAPEHLEIIMEKPQRIIPLIRNAGAVFVGPDTPTALGDYVAGPSHVLPTGGTARFFSVLSVDAFLKRVSCLRYDRASIMRAGPAAQRLAVLEGLEAHAKSVGMRMKKRGSA